MNTNNHNKLMSLCSGVYDVNGLEICDGHDLEITIKPVLGGGNIVNVGKVKFVRGAFRFIRDGRETPSICIGDFAYNCDLKILLTPP